MSSYIWHSFLCVKPLVHMRKYSRIFHVLKGKFSRDIFEREWTEKNSQQRPWKSSRESKIMPWEISSQFVQLKLKSGPFTLNMNHHDSLRWIKITTKESWHWTFRYKKSTKADFEFINRTTLFPSSCEVVQEASLLTHKTKQHNNSFYSTAFT